MERSPTVRIALAVAVAAALALGGCGDSGVDPTPEDQFGVPSDEFEPDDIERANNASDAVKDYCEGVKERSEAQYVGCLSHVDESDIP